MRTARQVILWLLDLTAISRVGGARVLSTRFRRHGADAGILDEALDGARHREAKRTAEMMMWAGAVAGVGPFPNWFPVSHHVRRPENRAASERALRAYLEARNDAPSFLWRQYFLLSEPESLDELRLWVESDLTDQLTATRGVRADRMNTPTAADVRVRALRDAIEALDALGTKPFLVSGTLLGHVRDGKLMEHDYDVDLGVLPGAASPDAIGSALEAAGFDVEIGDLKVVARDQSGFAVDTFLHYERDGLLWHGTNIHEWWNTPFGLVRAELEGVPVWIPDDADTYLDENYGTWERPIAFYDFSFDTPNRCYRQSSDALLYLHKRLRSGLQLGDRWATESATRELRDSFGVDLSRFLQPSGLLRQTTVLGDR